MISGHLGNFAWNQDKANFRCPFCGDSQKNKLKKRAWLLPHHRDTDRTVFKCHNCDLSTNLSIMLKEHFPTYYKNYLQDRFLTKRYDRMDEVKKEVVVSQNIDITHKLLLKYSLPMDGTPGETYLINRKIKDLSVYRFTNNCGAFLKSLDIKGYDNLLKFNYSAIIIPFIGLDDKMYAFQFRFLSGDMRYITIKINKEIEYKVWGLERLDFNKPFFVTEGVFDAACLPNSIAMCGSSINFDILEDFKETCVILFDNEKENAQIVKKMKDIINKNYKLFVWDKCSVKDVNEYLIKYGNIDMFLNKKPVKGLAGKMEILKWQKQRMY